MKHLVLIILFGLSAKNCGDTGALSTVASLPHLMNEVSGIEMVDGSPLVWMVNDSGNTAEVFGYNTSTKDIERAIKIKDVHNKDWEDLASNPDGDLFIGDFGNNISKRKNLVIYTLHDVANVNSAKAKVTKTKFFYEDQKKFPPKKKDRLFDVEAFIWKDGYFYLFTRNRSTKFDGTTKVYKVLAAEGEHEAKLIAEYTTCNDPKECQITSAAIDATTGTIALLSYSKVWLLSDYTEDAFFKGKVQEVDLGFNSQKESIVFKNSSELFIADERNPYGGGNLYKLTF